MLPSPARGGCRGRSDSPPSSRRSRVAAGRASSARRADRRWGRGRGPDRDSSAPGPASRRRRDRPRPCRRGGRRRCRCRGRSLPVPLTATVRPNSVTAMIVVRRQAGPSACFSLTRLCPSPLSAVGERAFLQALIDMGIPARRLEHGDSGAAGIGQQPAHPRRRRYQILRAWQRLAAGIRPSLHRSGPEPAAPPPGLD